MNKILENAIHIVVGAVVAFLILQGLGVGLNTHFPVVSVVSGSMRHDTATFDDWVRVNNRFDEVREWTFNQGLKEGDMLIIVGAKKESLDVGDVVVYKSPMIKYPIIHRIIEVTQNETYIIKGDNNPAADPQEVRYEWIQGRAVFAVPGLGLPRYAVIKVFGI